MFFPLITEDTFRQEGWHYEMEGGNAPLVFKGVVFNEMKGAYSSPSAVLGKASQQSLYPDTTYGVDSGGDPKAIPDLTYEYFKNFHAKYYHPSNARIVFYGDDDPEQRLDDPRHAYLSQFERIEVDAPVKLQPRFTAPRKLTDDLCRERGRAGQEDRHGHGQLDARRGAPIPRPCSRSTSSSMCWSAIPPRRSARR